ncbi:MAG: DivIVA domain-containing protein [Nitrospinaceae bacterium]
MRLTYLDILEQCFHDKFRGYNKQEVDTFLHLIADDFKSMAEETQELRQKLDTISLQELETRITPEVEEELQNLRKKLEEKDLLIEKMKKAEEGRPNENSQFLQLTPEVLKEKTKTIINTAKQYAKQHKFNAEKELDSLKIDIEKLQKQKQQLMDNIRTTAVEHLNKFKAGT